MYHPFGLIVVATVAFATASTYGAPADKLKTSDEILDTKTPNDDTDPGGEIDELMPAGEGDEVPDDKDEPPRAAVLKLHLRADADQLHLRADADKTLEELAPMATNESTYAPSDESFEYFSKKAAHEYTMADVEAYERANDLGKDKRWPDGVVPYEFDPEIKANKQQQDIIYAAMKEWEQKTCIQFQPYTPALAKSLGHNQRVKIVANDRGCWSRLGRMGERWRTPQLLSLERNNAWGSGCMHARVALHELGHTLGLVHEQSRMDRDQYLDVYMQNVQAGLQSQYRKGRGFSDDYPYDYLSIMHYGKDAFGKIQNGRKLVTMRPKADAKCYEDLMGKAKHLSYYDHQLINNKYGCDKDCQSMKCDKDCYATKSGENKQCHCVCVDHSNDPCMGGKCFGGDRARNCQDLVARYGKGLVCEQVAAMCCKSCM